MPKLLERAGNSDRGSITGLYTVLVDGDDFNEPITDTARGILDGHIVLSRQMAQKNHYPAIDILQSISRVMSSIITKEHKVAAGKMKQVLATYQEAEDLINIGAYKAGSNPDIDFAIDKIRAVDVYKRQTYTDQANLSYRYDGNNVDINTENVELAKNQLKYYTLMNSMSQEFSRLKSALRTS